MERKLNIQYTQEFVRLLHDLNITLVFSSYQSSRVVFVGASSEQKLFQIPVNFKKPMGLVQFGDSLGVSSLDELTVFTKSEHLGKTYPENPDKYDTILLPRVKYYTGNADIHDIAYGKGDQLWAVCTQFSCIATLDHKYNFNPRWIPDFISQITPGDRCHLNGMATRNGVPIYATVLGKTNEKEGWRPGKNTDGMILSVPDSEVILSNLAMPHSPRWIEDKLYYLESATGALSQYDPKTKSNVEITKVNSFIRGMASFRDYLFVGMSKIRNTNKAFADIGLMESSRAGIVAINRKTGENIGELFYMDTIEEIFDVQVCPNWGRPAILNTYNELHREAFTIPSLEFWRKKA